MAAIKREVCEESLQSEREGYQIIYIKEENLEDDYQEYGKTLEHTEEEQLQTFLIKEEDWREEDWANLQNETQTPKDGNRILETPNQVIPTIQQIPERRTSQVHESHQTEWKIGQSSNKVNMRGMKTEMFEDVHSSDIQGYQIIYVKEENLEDDWREKDLARTEMAQSLLQQDRCSNLKTISQSVPTTQQILEKSILQRQDSLQIDQKVNGQDLGEKISSIPSPADTATIQSTIQSVSSQRESSVSSHCEDQEQSTAERKSVDHSIVKRTHTGEKPYQCSNCNKGFTSNGNLTRHMRIHTGEKPYQCSVCNKGFTDNGNYTTHMRTHTGEKPYQCSVCNKGFTRRSQLTIHNRTHTGEKPYHCSVCNKRFTSKNSLILHMRTHTGEKPYQCTVCCKAYARSGHLLKHMRIHTGEKPYQCSICNKGFFTSSTLTNHKRTHTGEKPYQCSICNKLFSQKSNLTSHMRIHTGEKPY